MPPKFKIILKYINEINAVDYDTAVDIAVESVRDFPELYNDLDIEEIEIED